MAEGDPRNGVCPYLGKEDDSTTFFAYPSPSNHCYRPEQPVRLASTYQGQFCLKGEHLQCPVFSPGWAGVLPKELVPPRHSARRGARPRALALAILLAALISLGAAGAGWWFLMAPAPGSPPAGLHASLTPPPTVGPSPTAAALPEPLQAAGSPAPTASPPPSATPTLSQTPTQIPPPTPGPALETPISPQFPLLIHRVLPGESLMFLAVQYNTSIEAIRAVNGIENALLWVDQLLVIPFGMTEVSHLPAFVVYQVPPEGQTVDQVAQLFAASQEDLRLYNTLGARPELPGGRWLIIPVP